MYDFYIDKILLPVTPGAIEINGKSQNKTLTLINDEEINILKKEGLREVKFEALLPNTEYPFAKYKSGFKKAKYFLDEIEKLKKKRQPFQFKIIRMLPNGKLLFNTNIKMAIEDVSTQENAGNGFDIMLKISLKEYRDYKTKTAKIVEPKKKKAEKKTVPVQVKTVRPESSRSPAPLPAQPKTYKVVAGDSLWVIAKKFYGDGSKYPVIANANKDKIANPNLIYPNQVLTIPPL